MKARGLLVIVVLVLLAISARSASAGGAELGFPMATCSNDGSATVTFSWEAMPGAIYQWLDLSMADNGFAPRSFVGMGPFQSSQTTVNWPGIVSGEPHYWRINTLTASGWVTSETQVFVACSPAVLLWGPLECQPDGTATVDFHWAPTTTAGIQWLDLSINGASFAAGTFDTSGPLFRSVSSYLWTGLKAGAVYYFRVNSFALSPFGWLPSETAGFYVDC